MDEMREKGYFILDDMHVKFGNYPTVSDNVIFESDEEEEDEETY